MDSIKLFLKNHLTLSVAYFLVLFSIPVATYLYKTAAAKNQNPTPAAQVQSPKVAAVISMSTPQPSPTVEPTSNPTQTPVKTTTKKTTSSKTIQNPGPKTPGIPVRVQIPKIGMNATVETVGLEADGTMSVPKSWWTVGWYSLGYKIGDSGSAVFSGHYDTSTGAPAVFYRVGSLSPGDIITVTNANGAVYKFRVYKKESYPWNQMPLQTIFATSGRVQLNLITCSGTWDKTTRNYSHRTVVYSEVI